MLAAITLGLVAVLLTVAFIEGWRDARRSIALRRALRDLIEELHEEADEWRADHPTGDIDEVDYASGLRSAAADLEDLLGEGR